MTKAEKLETARRARRYGYFKDAKTLWVFCPLCRDAGRNVKVSAVRGTGSDAKRLDQAMLDHLDDSHSAKK